MGSRNQLGAIDLGDAKPYEPKRKKKTSRRRLTGYTKTRRMEEVRRRERRTPIPVPKNKSLSEIEAMDAEDPAFKVTNHTKPKPPEPGVNWKQVARWDKQHRSNKRKGAVRKWDAKVEAAARVLEKHVTRDELENDIYDDDKLIAEGMLEMTDWTVEELIRGFRKNRNGKFGQPPKYIPREVQQAAFRQLVARGDRKLKQAYYDSLAELVALAQSAGSEKVRLDAIREVMNRVVGKVPDRVHVAQEQPWEGVLADSLIPIGEALPLDLEKGDDGIFALPPGNEEDYFGVEGSGEGVDALPATVAATVEDAHREMAPPSPRIISEVAIILPTKPKRAKKSKKAATA